MWAFLPKNSERDRSEKLASFPLSYPHRFFTPLALTAKPYRLIPFSAVLRIKILFFLPPSNGGVI